MLYEAYQAQDDLMAPARGFANLAARSLAGLPPALADFVGVRALAAGCEMFGRAHFIHERPLFGIPSVQATGASGRSKSVKVEEVPVDVTPFCTLLRFEKAMADPGPRVLLVAPLSGHFTTLLRETIRTLLRDHDVYVTDWHNARDVPLSDGRFGLDEYTDVVIRSLDLIGPGAHVIAVCQPCVPVLAAVALMSEDRHRATPKSMTLMAGPIDTRVNPAAVNELALSKSIEWFELHVVTTVPARYAGHGRRVYPGFLQVTAFLGMNPARHLRSHMELYRNLVDGDAASADSTKAFYDEYFAVLDMDADFYLETVQKAFQDHDLARGVFTVHGRVVDPGAITRTALLTVEGERDDICSVGQTVAAQDLCTKLRPHQRHHHLQPGVGHYGVFSGSRWENQVYPVVRTVIREND
ncbi:MAG: polyhydroxyalkanoate depolymerase [Acidimicrobiia bacterium]